MNIQSLNKPERKIARGTVHSDGGPICRREKDSHVCWWLFEDADVSSFHMVEGIEDEQG